MAMESNEFNAAYLHGRKVCATGRLLCLTHVELRTLVEASGGKFLTNPSRTGFLMVVGDGGWPAENNGQCSIAFERARKLKAYGFAIEFISEDDFLEALGLKQSAHKIRGPHTISDLARIFELSPVRIRRWVRLGLIQPVATTFKIQYFDFHQVAFLKQLSDVVRNGASIATVKSGIEKARGLLPNADLLYSLWTDIEADGTVFMRLRDELVDQHGQVYFDFEDAENEPSTVFAEAITLGFHELCDEALKLEDEHRFEEAAHTYRRALELQPDNATLHFDLGNVLFQLEQYGESADCFQRAITLDDEFAMAWHNWGTVQAVTGDFVNAERSLRASLRLAPNYADSHQTLSEILRHTGRISAAAHHARLYEEHSAAAQVNGARTAMLRVVSCEDEKQSS